MFRSELPDERANLLRPIPVRVGIELDLSKSVYFNFGVGYSF